VPHPRTIHAVPGAGAELEVGTGRRDEMCILCGMAGCWMYVFVVTLRKQLTPPDSWCDIQVTHMTHQNVTITELPLTHQPTF